MDEALKELYNRYWDQYRENILFKVEAAFPFLLVATEKYEAAEKRVMFCGQETYSWNQEEYKDPESATVESVRRLYDSFVNNSRHNSPYWNFQRKVRSLNRDAGFITNNIVKIGKKHAAGCSDSIDELARKHFPVFGEELKILRPDKIVFLTGPNYDWRIRNTLGSFSTEHYGDADCLCDRLLFDAPALPEAIRINHPGWLVRKGLYSRMASIVDQFIKE